MSGFLRYVVERALAGEGDQLKEYVIGVAVFGRGDDYDPRLDSIVRVEARRLRTQARRVLRGRRPRRPDRHSACRAAATSPTSSNGYRSAAAPQIEHGTASRRRRRQTRWRPGLDRRWRLALLVALPLAFTAVANGALTSVGRATPMVTIAVLPFAEYSNDPADELLAARLTDGVTSELARIRTLGVVSHTSALQFAGTRRPLREIAQALNAELILEGSVHDDGRHGACRSAPRRRRAIDRKIWVDDFVGTAARASRAANAASRRRRNVAARSRRLRRQAPMNSRDDQDSVRDLADTLS